MPSPTSKTEDRRRKKQPKKGRDRKQKMAKKGTTPKFPIHPEKAKGKG